MLADVDTHKSFEPLSDAEWNQVSCLFRQVDGRLPGRPRRDPRALLNAMLWVITQDERWHRLPRNMPPAQTCYNTYLQWKKNGIFEKVAAALSDRFKDIPWQESGREPG
jgi:transposase